MRLSLRRTGLLAVLMSSARRTNRSCKTTDMGLVRRRRVVFSSAKRGLISYYQNYMDCRNAQAKLTMGGCLISSR